LVVASSRVRRIREVRRAEVVEHHHGEVAGALVEVQLVEVRPEMRIRGELGLVVRTARDPLGAQRGVARPVRLPVGPERDR